MLKTGNKGKSSDGDETRHNTLFIIIWRDKEEGVRSTREDKTGSAEPGRRKKRSRSWQQRIVGRISFSFNQRLHTPTAYQLRI